MSGMDSARASGGANEAFDAASMLRKYFARVGSRAAEGAKKSRTPRSRAGNRMETYRHKPSGYDPSVRWSLGGSSR